MQKQHAECAEDKESCIIQLSLFNTACRLHYRGFRSICKGLGRTHTHLPQTLAIDFSLLEIQSFCWNAGMKRIVITKAAVSREVNELLGQ